MSGFFAVSAVPEQPPLPPVDVPILRAARGWAPARPVSGRRPAPGAGPARAGPARRTLRCRAGCWPPVRPDPGAQVRRLLRPRR